jgi:hypothetical protein
MFDEFIMTNLEDLKNKFFNNVVPPTIKTVVEVSKGTLTKQSLVEAVKKEFATTPDVVEGVILGDLRKCDPKMSAIISKYFIEIKAQDFVVNYLVLPNSKGTISKITAIICDSIEPSLQEMLNKNQQIVRIRK